jgi:hypothetical protein
LIKLLLWETNLSLLPTDPEERMKLVMGLMQMVKEEVDKGMAKMWGISPSGRNGFSITKRDEKDILAQTMKFTPYVKFTVEPMLSANDALAVLQQVQE